MSTENRDEYQSVLYGYLKKYQDDPNSRVFAPLAEAYRKANRVDEAIEIAREGLRIHPHFIGGRVALARALFDKKLYQEVIDELKPVVRDAPDNLVAQRLLAEAHLILGQVAEALAAYKMLLYFFPQDIETARIVQELEAEAYESGSLVLRNDPKSDPALDAFDVATAPEAFDGEVEVRKERWIRRVEFLQAILQKVERYRACASRTDVPG